MDLYYSNDDTNTAEDVANINWEYVGYILLSDNVTANFNSRELKSANVPAHRASFIKLVLYENHKNEFNVNNQVNIDSIQTRHYIIAKITLLGEFNRNQYIGNGCGNTKVV